jgi:hypothetical protein
MHKTLWVAFSRNWHAFFEREFGKPFNFGNVAGNCSMMANLYIKFTGGAGRVVYGHFHGQITHPFWEQKVSNRFCWVVDSDLIFDPSRWCFLEGQEPTLGISLLESTDYEPGQSRLAIYDNQNKVPNRRRNGKAHVLPQFSEILGTV